LCIEPRGAQVVNSVRMHAKTENTKEAANTFRYCVAFSSASVVISAYLLLPQAP
jgi:hypothetical protein